MKHLQLAPKLNKKEVKSLEGTLLDDDSYDEVIREETTILDENGDILLIYKPRVLSNSNCVKAFTHLKGIRGDLSNRGNATGKDFMSGSTGGIQETLLVKDKNGELYKTKTPRVKSALWHETKGSGSGIIGYFDRYIRIPYCRQTSFNMNYPEKFEEIYPFVREVNEVFKKSAPKKYKAQMKIVKETEKDWVISKTAFTTITVNNNWQTAVHTDRGDYEKGLGVMTCLRTGTYDGCYLVFPEYRIAVDVMNKAVLLNNVHKFHGNSPFHGNKKQIKRISCVFYYREMMHKCLNAEQELLRAKSRTKGMALYD